MKYVLYKMSTPGWQKEYDNVEDARKELYSHICKLCREGEKVYDLYDNVVWQSETVDENSSIDDLLCTSCGCEYWFEEIE